MNIDNLIKKVKEYNPKDIDKIILAYNYAYELHKGQYRQSGEEYIIHPLNVAYILAELHADTDTLCAGLLHDTLEDTTATKEEIETLFSKEIASLVYGVTNFNKHDFTSKKDVDAANMRKIIIGITSDVRIIIIKLADRLHNMRTLEYMSSDKQKEKALETMEVYVPLAYYVGVNNIKSELEDISFSYLMPDEYKRSDELRKEIILNDTPYLKEMTFKIRELLNNNNIPNEMKIRIKNIYGVYRRLIRKDRDPHDLIAIKIMLEEINKCYLALGLVHSMYHPINNKFKDYICNPKNNMYQSLHTTVLTDRKDITQIQIRTKEMDAIATYGLPTFWSLYPEKGAYAMQDKLNGNSILFTINEMNEMHKSDTAFVREVKKELFSDKIEVYTTNGEIITLPEGSTPIDFAYKIHTEVGNHMQSVLVNGVEVPFSYKLKDKDRVVILTDELASPSKSWLKLIRTNHARRGIKEYYK